MKYVDSHSKVLLVIGILFIITYTVLCTSPRNSLSRLKGLVVATEDLKIDGSLCDNKPMALDISNNLKYIYDTLYQFTFQGVVDESGVFGPKKPELHEVHADYVWTKLDLESGSCQSTWYLGTTGKKTEYFIKTNDGPWLEDVVGTDMSNQGDLKHIISNPFIRLELPANSRLTLVFHSSGRNLLLLGNNQLWRFDNVLANRSYIYEHHIERLKEQLPYIFILFVVMVYHLVLYLYNKEISYLLLSLAACANMTLIAYDNDLLFHLLDIDNVGNFARIVIPFIYNFQLVVIPFIIAYLKIPTRSNIVKILWLWIGVNLFYWLAFYLLKAEHSPDLGSLFRISFPPMLFSTHILVLSVILYTFLVREKESIYLLVGYGTISFGAIMAVLYHMSFFSLQYQNLPIAVGFIFFAFGLSHRFKESRDGEIEASIRAIDAENESRIKSEEASRLREMDQFKSRLYTNITHEFRTPLTVISGMAEQLPARSEEKEYILRNSDKLLDLVNQMLDLSKIEAGKLEPHLSQVDVILLLRYFSKGYRTYAKSQNINFQLEVLDDAIWMDTDPQLLQRVCNNLVHNAIKFSPQESTISMRVQKTHQGSLRVQISDQGRGIPREEQEKIFDRFYQVDATNTRRGEGTGIGLALVKEIISILSGSITVESKEYSGSTFTVILPITNQAEIEHWHPRTDPNVNNRSNEPEKVSAPEDAPKILIVEDNADVRAYLHQLIQSSYHVILANDGRMGLSKAFGEIPDLIVSDVMMPEMDGFEFCATIKDDPRTSHIPVILVTAKSAQEDKLDGLQEGADAYLIKPFDPRELILRIEKLLEQREKARQHYQRFQILPEEEIKENRFLQKIFQHLQKNLQNEDYQIEDLASSVHLGRVQLFRKLKALTGKTYTQILREIRINKAKVLLRKTDKTSSEVAHEVGFRNNSYFTKVFKKVTGMTTSEFRGMN